MSTIKHAGRFDGNNQAFEDFRRQFKLFQNIDIDIDNQEAGSIWYSFHGGCADGIAAGKMQAFFERRDADLAYFETLQKQFKKQL